MTGLEIRIYGVIVHDKWFCHRFSTGEVRMAMTTTELSERLRRNADDCENMERWSTPELAPLLRSAATQLDSLLKERDALQAENFTLRAKLHNATEGTSAATKQAIEDELRAELAIAECLAVEMEARALRAEQERDEAIGLLKPFMPNPTTMDILWGDMDGETTGSHTIKLKHFRAARDLVRRLAGPEKISAANDGEERR